MTTILGVFNSTHDAESAGQQLRLIGIGETEITIVSPDEPSQADALPYRVPDDEWFVHEHALREGRTVLVAFVEDALQAESANGILRLSGAETLEQARDRWWFDLRGSEEEHYNLLGRNFREDELTYRKGFQAAFDRNIQGKPYQEALYYLRKHYPDVSEQSFRHGYERGLSNYQNLKEQHQL